MAKLTHRPQFLLLSIAVGQFKDNGSLINTLKEGQLVARGRLTTNFAAGDEGQFGLDTGPRYGEPVPIPPSAWRDMEAIVDNNILQDAENFISYGSIEIANDELERLRRSGPNLGGRSDDHDWELILKQAMVWNSQHPIATGTTLDGWIKELAVSLPYCVEHDVPKEDALKNKLRDVYHALVNDRPLPVGKPKRNRR